MFRKLLFISFLLVISNDLFSQSENSNFVRCSAIEYEDFLKSKNPSRKTLTEFENWLQPLIVNEKKTSNTTSRNVANSVIKVPVVIHIIHNGDAVGTGENISDDQALSQITVLNQDFRKMVGTPGANANPVGADTEIEFVLAKRKPDGTATTGIDRVQVSTTQFTSMANVETMKQTTVWDSSKYLNIWTVRIGGGSAIWNGTLGYAQFPSYSGISGMGYNNPTTEALTDGLVMRHDAFGSRTLYPAGIYGGTSYDKGRTATHELGHWAGLRHIWGDDACGNDFCADTPTAHDSNGGCPIVLACDGASNEMVENYMDYTDDACMNIFTLDQKTRITTVFKNADRRSSLLYSDALVPIGLNLEGGISLESEGLNNCSTVINPVLRLKNYGATAITSAQITYSLDGVNTQTYNFSGNLASGASASITLGNLSFAAPSQFLYSNIALINGVSVDGYADNNSLKRTVYRPKATSSSNLTLNLQLDYYGTETSWDLRNSAGVVVASGNNYPDVPNPNASTPLPDLITVPFNLTNNECYTFTMNDSLEDGLGYGGYYEIVDANGNIMASGGSFRASSQNKFSILTLLKEEFEFANLNLSPNPNKGNFTVELDSDSDNVKISVFDMSGRQIFENSFENNGYFNQEINLDNAQSGVYLVSISDGTRKTVKRIIIE